MVFNHVDFQAPDGRVSSAAFADGAGCQWAHRRMPVECVAAAEFALP